MYPYPILICPFFHEPNTGTETCTSLIQFYIYFTLPFYSFTSPVPSHDLKFDFFSIQVGGEGRGSYRSKYSTPSQVSHDLKFDFFSPKFTAPSPIFYLADIISLTLKETVGFSTKKWGGSLSNFQKNYVGHLRQKYKGPYLSNLPPKMRGTLSNSLAKNWG